MPLYSATVPRELLQARELSDAAKLLYIALDMLTPLNGNSIKTTFAELRGITGHCQNTVKKSLHQLEGHGWVTLVEASHHTSISYKLHDPYRARRLREVQQAETRIGGAVSIGQAIMVEIVTLLVKEPTWKVNAEPSFLRNPHTGAQMHYDLYFPHAKVAFEFQGSQHRRPTEKYPNYDRQRGLDMTKIGLSHEQGVKLIQIYPEDLSMQVIRRKIGNTLPLAEDLSGHRDLADYLQRISGGYRRKVRESDRVAT